jgi:sterol desaturase/sphingolipid hydroxylase (fatty acid hydroxylase superfamily)
MDIFQILFEEAWRFLQVSQALALLQSGDLSALTTYDGLRAVIRPAIPLLLIFEAVLGLIYRKPQSKVYRVNFLIYVCNRFIGRFISFGMVLFCIGLFQRYAPLQVSLSWFGFIYAYLVWELGHFLYHYLAHKVRLLWCLHSTHHAPEDMNLSVTHAHFFLEAPYADTIRTTVCILLGVQPELLFLIMFIDGTYGAFIHIGDNLVKDARFGVLNKIMLTPSHHRVHHARNPLYIDTNFCNLLNVWDRIFGTYQEEDRSLTIDYGINRKMNSGSFLDVYFGEFVALGRDLRAASGLKNKLLYLLMPPGWHPGGEHHTAAVVREQYLNTVGRGI